MTAEHLSDVDLLFQGVAELGWETPKPTYQPMQAVPMEDRDTSYDKRAASWCAKSLTGKADDLAAMLPDSGRNHALNAAGYVLLRYVLAGHLEGEQVYNAMRDAALEAGLGNGEIEATLGSAQRAAQRDGPAEPPIDGQARDPFASLVIDPTTGEVSPPMTSESDAPMTPATMTPEEAAQRRHENAVRMELAQLRARDEAKRLYTAERAALEFREPPYRVNLTAELREPRLPTRFAVQDLLPMGGNALLTAQYKAGKTTLTTELCRSWVDREPFLGRFAVHGTRRVALMNYELSQNQYNDWLEQVGIVNTDAVSVLHLRGFRMDIRSERGEDWMVAWLKDNDVGLWVPDPFARAAVGVDENSNTEVGVWLDTLDVIKERAGVDQCVLPVHTGRAAMDSGQERARGATRLDDWADVRWLLTKDDAGERYFRASGRDVEMEEEKLSFDAENRRLTIGGGDRAWHAKRRAEDSVVAFVSANPGSNSTTIAAGIGGDKTSTPRALASAVAARRLKMASGRGPEKLYYPVGTILSEDPTS